MKKNYLIILSLFLFSNSIFSQDVRFGLVGGVNSCGLYGPDKPQIYDKQIGFSGGVFIDSRFAEYMSSQVEINFTRYKFQFSQEIETIIDASFNIKEKNDYIRIPVTLKYKRGHEFAFYYISAGIQAAVLINSDRDVTASSRGLEIDSKSYYNYKQNWYDYGLIAGAGFQFKPVTIGVTYYYSMRNLYTKDDAWEMRYKTLSLNMSWQFNYVNKQAYERKTGWKGLKHKIKNIF